MVEDNKYKFPEKRTNISDGISIIEAELISNKFVQEFNKPDNLLTDNQNCNK